MIFILGCCVGAAAVIGWQNRDKIIAYVKNLKGQVQ